MKSLTLDQEWEEAYELARRWRRSHSSQVPGTSLKAWINLTRKTGRIARLQGISRAEALERAIKQTRPGAEHAEQM